MKTIKTSENREYKVVSRWLKIKTAMVTSRHSLYDYADSYFEEENGKRDLVYFTYKGKQYALSQFLRLDYPKFFTDDNGKKSYLSGYDSTDYYNPLLIEIDACGGYVRLFEQIIDNN